MKTFYYNGRVISSQGETEAVITDNGKVTSVGSFDDVQLLCDENTVHYNLDGNMMISAPLDEVGDTLSISETEEYLIKHGLPESLSEGSKVCFAVVCGELPDIRVTDIISEEITE